MVLETLKANKSVFVEKPLCLTKEELTEIEKAYAGVKENVTLTVGLTEGFLLRRKDATVNGEGQKILLQP